MDALTELRNNIQQLLASELGWNYYLTHVSDECTQLDYDQSEIKITTLRYCSDLIDVQLQALLDDCNLELSALVDDQQYNLQNA